MKIINVVIETSVVSLRQLSITLKSLILETSILTFEEE